LGGVANGLAKHMLAATVTGEHEGVGAHPDGDGRLETDRGKEHRRGRVANKHGENGGGHVDSRQDRDGTVTA